MKKIGESIKTKTRMKDVYGNFLSFQGTEVHALSTEKESLRAIAENREPGVKLYKRTDLYLRDGDYNLAQVYLFNKESEKPIVQYDEFYLSDDKGNTTCKQVGVEVKDNFFKVATYSATQSMGEVPLENCIERYYDYNGKEIPLSKVVLNKRENLDKLINDYVEEQKKNQKQ